MLAWLRGSRGSEGVASDGHASCEEIERKSRTIEETGMNLTVEIPDDVAKRLTAAGGDLSRRALEALVADEYRHGRLNKPDLRRLLGFETSDQIDTFLREHEVWIDYTADDLERERAGLQRLGL